MLIGKNGIERTQPDQKDCVSLKGDLAVKGSFLRRKKRRCIKELDPPVLFLGD